MKRLWITVALAAVPGCHHYYKLDVDHVVSLTVAGVSADGSLRVGGTLCARGALVEVIATTADGRTHQQGLRTLIDASQFDPALVRLTASSGEFHDRSWNPPPDPLALLAQPTVTVTVTLVANPAIQHSAAFTPTWACDPPVAYVGGGDGSGGAFGASASEPGQPGRAGGVGQRGADGYHSTVSLGWLQRTGARLAIADVVTRGLGEAIFVLDASTPLELLANGGYGGGGGTGGFGGATEVGVAGRGGRGGDGGDGGDGGTVIVRFDAASPELQRLVTVENHGGHGGPHGYAGGGGMSLDKQTVRILGDGGDNGHAGQVGKAGPPPVFEDVEGLSLQLTALADGGGSPRAGSAAEGGGGPVEHRASVAMVAQVALPPLAAGHFLKPMDHGDVDGARQYEGDSELELSQPQPQQQPPTSTIHHRQTIHVESTRTSAGHFTITFSENVTCKLELHRPPGEPRNRYVLDAPAICSSPTLIYAVRAATLVVDARHDEIELGAEGTGSIAKSRTPRGPMTFHFRFSGKRR